MKREDEDWEDDDDVGGGGRREGQGQHNLLFLNLGLLKFAATFEELLLVGFSIIMIYDMSNNYLIVWSNENIENKTWKWVMLTLTLMSCEKYINKDF
jgi:hypothetical protein